MLDQKTMTEEDRAANRIDRLNEPGTLSRCPYCQRPRVQRSTYIRCNPCGINWLDEEMHLPNYLNLDPRVARGRQRQSAGMATKTDSSAEHTTGGVER